MSPGAKWTYFTYDAASNRSTLRLGNGTQAYYAYDAAERPSDIRHIRANGSAIAYFQYGRDRMGQVTSIVRESDLSIYYAYDAVGRLASERWKRKSDGVQIYGFT